MRDRLGDAWGPNLQEAWSNLFSLIYEALVIGIEQRRSVDTVALTSEFASAQQSLSQRNEGAARPKSNVKQVAAKRTGLSMRLLTRTGKTITEKLAVD